MNLHWLLLGGGPFLGFFFYKTNLGGGGWCWIYFGQWWVVVGGSGYIWAGGGWWQMAVGGDIVQSNPIMFTNAGARCNLF